MALTPGEYVLLNVPAQFCPICQISSNKIGAVNEVVITDNNELLGVQGVVRFEDCGHRVPNAFAHPVSIASMLDAMNGQPEDVSDL